MDFQFVPEAARTEIIGFTRWQLSIYAPAIAISIAVVSLGFVLLNWDIVAEFGRLIV